MSDLAGWIMIFMAFVLAMAMVYIGRKSRKLTSTFERPHWLLLALPKARIDALRPPLEKAGWEIQPATSDESLRDLLAEVRPSAVLLDQTERGEEVVALESHDATVASTPILFLDAQFMSREPQALRAWLPPGARAEDVLQVLERLVSNAPGPLQLSRRDEFEGHITPTSLLDLLHFLASVERSGRIEVRNGGAAGWIWLERGRIRHCMSGNLDGTEALHSLLDLTKGSFAFRSGIPAPEHSIELPTLYLLHEYTRQRDERVKTPGN